MTFHRFRLLLRNERQVDLMWDGCVEADLSRNIKNCEIKSRLKRG